MKPGIETSAFVTLIGLAGLLLVTTMLRVIGSLPAVKLPKLTMTGVTETRAPTRIVGLKDFSSDKRITSRASVSPLTTESRTYGCGSTSTNGLTVALMKRLTCPRSGSLETRRTDLEIGPEKLFVSTEVWTLPSAPGLTTLSKEATVHPQPGRASEITRS